MLSTSLKKVKRNIGIFCCKLRFNVQTSILVSLYYALLYPFLIYGLLAWGNTYPTTLQPIFMLQKKAVRLITFSSFDAHSIPLFKKLSILKMNDLVEYYVAISMFKYNNNLLPPVFKNVFVSVSNIHKYQTRSATKENSIFQKQKPTMENLILDSKARKLGMLLKNLILDSKARKLGMLLKKALEELEVFLRVAQLWGGGGAESGRGL